MLQQINASPVSKRRQGAGLTITMVYNHIEKGITQNKRVKGRLNKIKKSILNI